MPVDIARVARALLRGKWWILAVGLFGSLIGYGTGKFIIPSSFVSKGVLKFDGVDEVAGVGISQGDVGSLVESIQSRPVLERVRDRLGLPASLQELKARTVIIHDRENKSVKVHGSAGNAEDASELVGALMEVFRDYQAERQRKRFEDELTNVDERLSAIQTNLGTAREAYDAFRQEHGISDLTTEQRREIEAATKARTDADVAAAEIQALEARISQLGRVLQNTPRTVTSTRASPESQQLAQLQGELGRLRGRLSEDHPQVLALQQQIQTLRLRIASGDTTQVAATSGRSERHRTVETDIQTSESELAALRERHAGLQDIAERSAARIAQFSEIEGRASALKSRVEVNQTLATQLQQSAALLQDALRQPTSGFSVLTPPTVPDYPERNKQKYIVAAAIPSVLVGIVLFLLLYRELKGLRVRTAREVGYWGKGPVLGTTTWPRDQHAVQDLIADLDDYAPEATGRMLVVGATEAETALAHEIVDQLNNDWFPSSLIDLDAYSASPDAIPLGSGESTGTALATRGNQALASPDGSSGPTALDSRAWDGPPDGQALRRAARLADRVMVVVTSGAMSAVELSRLPTRLGRSVGVGYVLVGIEDELAGLPDRAGPVERFWHGQRE